MKGRARDAGMRHWWSSRRLCHPPAAQGMSEYNPKRVAVVVLLAGGVLAGVAAKHKADESARESSAPILVEIPSSLDTTPDEDEVVRTYNISGMCCASCTKKLHDRIAGLSGVEACAVDLPGERLTLIVRKDLAPERILSRLSFDKYIAVELP